jgi:D-xylose transport system permease protein
MNRLSFRDFSLVLALMAIVAVFAWQSPVYLDPRNLSNLAVEFSIIAVLALGVFLVLLPGQTDLSTGSGVGLFGGVAAVLLTNHLWPAPLAMGAAFVGAVVLWALMGLLIVKQRIPAFIITLAGMLVFRGLHWLVIQNNTIPVRTGGQDNLLSSLTTWYLPAWAGWAVVGVVALALAISALKARTRRREHQLTVADADSAFAGWLIPVQLLILLVVVMNQFNGVPLPMVILGITAVTVYILSRHTPFGRHLYAIGGNAEASRVSGIPVERTIVTAFALCGVTVALTGFLQTSYAGSSTATIGQYLELDAIAACVIGGVSLSGGKGSVAGVLFGALIMTALLNGMTLLAMSPESKLIARGSVLALAVWMDVYLSRRR